MLRYGWNVTLVASLLGVSRMKLLRRLNHLGLERPTTSAKARPRGASPAEGDPIDAALRAVMWPRAVRRGRA
jgi:hypothetical protein